MPTININIKPLNSLPPQEKNKILNRGRSQADQTSVREKVEVVLNQVQESGDQALFDFTEKFDGVKLDSLWVGQQEIERAFESADPKFLKAANQLKDNLEKFCQSQLDTSVKKVETAPGVTVWKEWRPIERVGLYVPGGQAIYPSTVLMTVVPAIVAGCQEIVIATPPPVSPYILAVAAFLGVQKILQIGGAHAIGALAYGTESVKKVDKIFGPGNQYVTTAKQLVSNFVSIDMPAGESENVILADGSANPKFVAADLICDAEHSGDNPTVLLTDSLTLVTKVMEEMNQQAQSLRTFEKIKSSLESYATILLIDDFDEAIDFINDYAPEHLQLMLDQPQKLVSQIKNAGSVFLGQYSCKAGGDYATGANHTLPTGGQAKSRSALNMFEFGKWMEFQECSQEGLKNIAQTIETFAEFEGLPGHAQSAKVRYNSINN